MGTELPGGWRGCAEPEQVLAAVSAVCRVTLEEMCRRGDARRLFLAMARELCDVSPAVLGSWVHASRATVYRAKASLREQRLVMRVLGDPRFGALRDGPR